jgi:hypothetical protein
MTSHDSLFPVACYVHLGADIPKHLVASLIRHHSLFPDQDMILVKSKDHTFELPAYVSVFCVDDSKLESELFEKMSMNLDFHFRGGFWKYTLQRFFAMNELHKTIPIRPITHIESDVLVMPNFPWTTFYNLPKLAWLKVNSEIDVAAIVHFPSAEMTEIFAREVSKLAEHNPRINDMQALHEIAKTVNSLHSYLPSVPNSKNFNSYGVEPKGGYSQDYFGGIFDPAYLGLWYFGQDPKNSFGLRTRYVGDDSHDLAAANMHLSYQDNQLITQDGVEVFSLHLHAKYLPLFGAKWEAALTKGLNEAKSRRNKYSFHIKPMLQALQSRKPHQTIWILIAMVPGLGKLRRIRAFESIKNYFKRLLRIQ